VDDKYDGIDPCVLSQFYGVDRVPDRHTSGAGNPPDENDGESEEEHGSDMDIDGSDEDMDIDPIDGSDSNGDHAGDTGDWLDIEEQISDGIRHNFHHEPVSAPRGADPFQTQEARQAFQDLMLRMSQGDLIPDGYGILPEEWGDEGYPTYEVIPAGRNRRRELRVSLPDQIWRPRAVVWVQGLYAMTNISSWEQDHTI
jgi:hypothetical protein